MTVDANSTVPHFLESPRNASCSFSVGGVSVQVHSAYDADVNLTATLEPFRILSDSAVDITIGIERVRKLPLAPGRELFNSGSLWRLFEEGVGFRFDFRTPLLGRDPYKRLVIDDAFRQALLLLSDECLRDRGHLFPLEYPLDEVLITHRLAREKAIELHGCGIVGADGTGNLFVGHSGAGKSTTARLWTAREDVEVLSDDRIIVRREGGAVAAAPVGAPSTSLGISARGSHAAQAPQLRLRDCSGLRNSHSAQGDKAEKQGPRFARNDKPNYGMRMYGTPWHGEAQFASPASAPVNRICILEHGRGNVLTRLSPSQAVAELFARSFVPFHRHEYLEAALAFLEDVVDSIPCYRYSFEPDQRAVDTILNFHD